MRKGDRGIPASPGIAVGPARHLHVPELPLAEGPAGTPEEEGARLDAALAVRARRHRPPTGCRGQARGHGQAAIFDAHLLFLQDEALLAPTRAGIAGRSAAASWSAAVDELAAVWEGLEDPYLRERAADLRSVGRQVLAECWVSKRRTAGSGRQGSWSVRDLEPADTVGLDPASVGASPPRTAGRPPTRRSSRAPWGSPPSSVSASCSPGRRGGAARDRRWRRPPVRRPVSAHDRPAGGEAAEQPERTARAGRGPASPAGRSRREGAREHRRTRSTREGHRGSGGRRVRRRRACSGREFLFIGARPDPDEDEQERAYRAAAEALDGRPLTIRTLDVGADKRIPYLGLAPEANPFLGVRGIRLALGASRDPAGAAASDRTGRGRPSRPHHVPDGRDARGA